MSIQQLLLAAGGGGGGGDPYWANVVLLLHGDGVDEATNITDASNSAHTVTVYSGAKYDDTAAPPGRSTSIYLGNAGLSLAHSADFDFGSGDFTVETWMQQQTRSEFPVLFGKRATVNFSPFQCVFGSSNGDMFIRASNNGSSYDAQIAPTNAFSTSTWYHLAFCRSGTSFEAFLNGASLGTASMSGALSTNSDELTIGRGAVAGGNLLNGNISEFRITKGVARYAGTFTPPTIPFPGA